MKKPPLRKLLTNEKIALIDSDVSAGAKNLAELHAIRGIKPGLLIGPPKVGKGTLHQIAVELAKARKDK